MKIRNLRTEYRRKDWRGKWKVYHSTVQIQFLDEDDIWKGIPHKTVMIDDYGSVSLDTA